MVWELHMTPIARLLRPTWLTENSLSLLCLGASATCTPLCVCMTTANWRVSVSTTQQVQTAGNARRIIRADRGVQAHTSPSPKALQTPVSSFAPFHALCMTNGFFLRASCNCDFASFLFKMQRKIYSWSYHLQACVSIVITCYTQSSYLPIVVPNSS